MQVIHPPYPLDGHDPQNVFLAVDETGRELGRGIVVYQFLPHLYPDCPISIFFSLNAPPVCQYMLFGALLARARQIRNMDQLRGYGAWFYTNIQPGDNMMKNFYVHNGFRCEDGETIVRLNIPAEEGRVPMSCRLFDIPFQKPEDEIAFLNRMAEQNVTYLNAGYLAQLKMMPVFFAQGLFHDNEIVGEMLFAGAGENCELVAIYVKPAYRGRGMAKTMIHCAMSTLRQRNVRLVTARIMTRSAPQSGLVRAFGAEKVTTVVNYPGMAV